MIIIHDLYISQAEFKVKAEYTFMLWLDTLKP